MTCINQLNSIAIIGGGITGLTAACFLARLGSRVTVFEQSPALTDVGAGIQIAPNGYKVLKQLGLEQAVIQGSSRPQALETRASQGGRGFRILLDQSQLKVWGGDYRQIYRPYLIDILAEAAAEVGVNISLNAQVTDLDALSADHDLIIAADGFRSQTRAQLFALSKLRYSGYQAWRALIDLDKASDIPASACVWSGQGLHAVTYPLERARKMNFVGLVRAKQVGNDGPGFWQLDSNKSQALQDFQTMPQPVLDLLENADAIRPWPLYELPPLASWHSGKTIVLGDAAHPMLPSLAQGACQGMEDAAVLADCLCKHECLDQALEATYKRRIARVSQVQSQARSNLTMFHGQQPTKLRLASSLSSRILASQLDWLYGWQPPDIRI